MRHRICSFRSWTLAFGNSRVSPPTILGMRRLFKQNHEFANDLHVPKGTYACCPTFATENNPANTPHSEIFDELRSYRRGQQARTSDSTLKGNDEEHQISSTEYNILNFGYGKSACPGRFFANLVTKVLFVKQPTEYEFDFPPGKERPKNIMVHEFSFGWPWQKMLVRRKEDGTCPFQSIYPLRIPVEASHKRLLNLDSTAFQPFQKVISEHLGRDRPK